jgi:hypothetical protein
VAGRRCPVDVKKLTPVDRQEVDETADLQAFDALIRRGDLVRAAGGSNKVPT